MRVHIAIAVILSLIIPIKIYALDGGVAIIAEDGTVAVDLTASPTWTGNHVFDPTSGLFASSFVLCLLKARRD